MITADKRNGKWQVYFRYVCPTTGKRKRFRKNAPHATKRKALQWGKEQMERVTSPPARPPAPLFEDYIEMYIERSKAFLRHSTHKGRTTRLRGHLLRHFKGHRLDEITALVIDGYTSLRLEDVAPVTVRGDLAILSTILNQALDWDLIERVPKIRKPKVEASYERWFTVGEATAIVEQSKNERWLKNLVEFALNTGMRTGELVALRWDDIRMRSKEVVVRRSYSDGVTGPTKGGKPRTLTLNDTAWSALMAQRAQSYMRGGLVFCRDEGAQLTRDHLRDPWERALKRAGVEHCGMKTLRHTFASWLVQNGVSLQVVSELLGHADLKTTLIYAHLAPKNHSDAVAALDKIVHHLSTDQNLA
jgi:integrase